MPVDMLDIQSQIQSVDALHKVCEEQVAFDNAQFGIKSVYLPNPIFTLTPKYCLIAMEPSMGRISPEKFQSEVNQGFKNFLYSEGDFILHYCAYTFLCHQAFAYHITDISKGAMGTKLASSERVSRYTRWRSILQRELEFFGNPKLIAIGSQVRDFLSAADFQVEFSVLHFSWQNHVRFRDYYEQHSEKSLADNLHINLKKFATELLEGLKYAPELQDRILRRLFNNELSVWKRGMFLYYRDQFSANGGI